MAADDPVRVRLLETVGRLMGDVEGFLQLERTGLDFLGQALSFDEGRGDKGLAFDLIDFMDGANIGVIERCGRLRFTKETCPAFLVF